MESYVATENTEADLHILTKNEVHSVLLREKNARYQCQECYLTLKITMVVRAASGQSTWKRVMMGGKETDFTL